MNPSSKKGNSPERWEKLLAFLDEKLQLGLLDQLQKIKSYHFEAEILYIVPDDTNVDYFARPEMLQQLELLAQDAVQVERVKVKKEED